MKQKKQRRGVGESERQGGVKDKRPISEQSWKNFEFPSPIRTLFAERAKKALPTWRMEDQLLLYHTTDEF